MLAIILTELGHNITAIVGAEVPQVIFDIIIPKPLIRVQEEAICSY